MATGLSEREQRLERLRERVEDDHERVSNSDDPFEILNVPADSAWDIASAKYERFERFYRAENFQKLGDMELMRKALDVRRAISRALVEIQARNDDQSEVAEPAVTDLDPDARALGDIYYRDGLTYLRLGDTESSIDYLQRAVDNDPSRGIILAYLAYTLFRRNPMDDDVVNECRRSMVRAGKMDDHNADVFVLAARFFLKLQDVSEAEKCVGRVRELEPTHPKLAALEQRLRRSRV